MSGTGETASRRQMPGITGRQPQAPDMLESVAGDTWDAAHGRPVAAPCPSSLLARALPLRIADMEHAPERVTSEWLQVQARHLLREFLSVVPRSDMAETVTIPRADGTARTLTRAQLSVAIDRMRPRMRQIMRLAMEERRTQGDICELLGVSVRTVQRDQSEALDLLAQL